MTLCNCNMHTHIVKVNTIETYEDDKYFSYGDDKFIFVS